MSEVIIAAIAAALASVITVTGKVIVDVIKARRAVDEGEELKEDFEKEKDKNDAAIAAFTAFGEKIEASIDGMKQEMADMRKDIQTYRDETREINKSELRHSITQIYFENKDSKTLDLRTKDDLCSLYEAYSSIGGNSFAHELYEEMMNWDVR